MLRKAMAPALAWAALILGLCLLPGRELPQWDWVDLFSLDKFAHLGLFAVLQVLGVRGLRKQQPALPLRSLPVVLFTLTAVAYGCALELMQGALLQGRTADPLDAVANTLGCAVGLVYLARTARSGAVGRKARDTYL